MLNEFQERKRCNRLVIIPWRNTIPFQKLIQDYFGVDVKRNGDYFGVDLGNISGTVQILILVSFWINILTCQHKSIISANRRPQRCVILERLETTQINPLLTSKIDFCNSLLFGFSKKQLDKLQRIVLNAPARITTKTNISAHFSGITCV